MRVRLTAILCVLFLLAGCKNGDGMLDRAIDLRNRLLSSDGCSFRAAVTADYGENIYHFSMDCKTDKEGNLTFSVTEPETLEGISGKITALGGAITFEDKVLAFPMLADGQVTPVSAPWLFVKTLRGGYLKDCCKTDNGFQITIDDSYMEDALTLILHIENDLPKSCEIFWKGRRVLILAVEEFTYL